MGKLTIQEIAKVLVEKNNMAQRDANRFASEMFSLIQQRLGQGELVKVKGLGTFKIIGVEARESVSVRTGERVVIEGHSKVSFTPDATMKELVNKPFSQFDTVVLNEGVEFEDLSDNLTEEELVELDQLAEEEPAQPVESQQAEEVPQVVVEPQQAEEVSQVVEEPPVEQPEVAPVATMMEEPEDTPIDAVKEQPQVPVVEERKVEEEKETEKAEAAEEENKAENVQKDGNSEAEQEDIDEDGVDEDDADEENMSRPWMKWLLGALGVLALMALSAFAGYYYGCSQQPASVLPDTVWMTDTVYMAERPAMDMDEEVQEGAGEDTETTEVTTPEPDVKPVAVEKQPAKATSEPVKYSEASSVDPYAQKDERVRLGAYRIVGLDHEVKVLEGQTFYGICRAHLGPDMECYVEVYNGLPRNPAIKAGQTIKIPKLQLKKRSK